MDDAKVVLPSEVLELRWGKQGVEARIIPRRQGEKVGVATPLVLVSAP
jgi:hypothetical protein